MPSVEPWRANWNELATGDLAATLRTDLRTGGRVPVRLTFSPDGERLVVRASEGFEVWHVADRDSRWFAPSDAPFMINYRVDDLDALAASGGVYAELIAQQVNRVEVAV